MQKLFLNTEIPKIIDSTRSLPTSVFGLNLGERILLSSFFSAPICFVTADTNALENIARGFSSLGKRTAILDYSTDDFTLHTLEFGSNGLNNMRVLFNAINNNVDCIVATPQALALHTAPKEIWLKNTIKLEINSEIEPETLLASLISIGYRRVDSLDGMGQFARRGDVIDIFPLNSELPYRVHFFDTQIEKIASFNIMTQYSIENVPNITICPNGFNLDESEKERAIEILDAQVSAMQNRSKKAKIPADFMANLNAFSHAKELVKQGIPREAWHFCSAFTNTSTLAELLSNFTFVIDQPKQVFDTLSSHLKACAENVSTGIENGQLCPLHKNLVPEFDEITKDLSTHPRLAFQSLLTQNKFFAPESVHNFDTLPLPRLARSYSDYASALNEFIINNYKIILTAGDANIARDLADKLGRYLPCVVIANLDDARLNRINIFVHPLYLGACFVKEKILFLGSSENRFIVPKQKFDKKLVKATDAYTLPEQGDYVVHAIHGIGICEGVTKLEINGAKRDYVVVSYKDNARLYVPTEQLDMLGRYIGGEKNPTLSSIGGNAFEKVKQRVRESVKQLAFDLLALYRAREQSKGLVMKVDHEILAEFENSFPYTPTPDQQKAFDDVYNDLASGRIMDRLIVGDVGYGKTEVALRSAFVAVMSGYQVAVIVPTTILAEQHFNNFNSRLKNYGIEVRCLNRFRTPKEQKEIINDVKSGKVNILIGTHRALSNDVGFDNLGLLILDEEQRFGVGDKEKLKNLKKNIHVLTLTATPIPRTLHMSLVGIRDISTIETPPLDRLPVQTIVSQFSYNLIATALRREKARGGQSLVVYPRVENIEAFAQSLRAELGTDFRVAVAHGQMNKSLIENVMMSMYRGEIDVLVATTLIENGIDLPNANTLFVVSAEKLGLSQLYQLRGRVGRSDRLAYSYFTYMDEGKLTGQAYERLSVLMQYTALGSGFKIAMRDLEIRGAGNILGPEQHGQMEKVGYDTYCKILDSSIASLKGEPVREAEPVKIEVDIDAYIPDAFITDKVQRMEVYSLIANISNDTDAQNVSKMIDDKYGSVPTALIGLIDVARLKAKCQIVSAIRARIVKGKSEIYFHDTLESNSLLSSAKLNKFTVSKHDNLVILKSESGEKNNKEIWRDTFAVLDNLAQKISEK